MMSPAILSMGLGSLVGLSLALTGAGGAILAVPLLVFFLHLAMAKAAPLALFTVGLSAGVGALEGLKKGLVRYKAALLMASAGMAFAPLGAQAAKLVPNKPLMALFAVVLGWVAWRAAKKTTPPKPDRDTTVAGTVLCQLNPSTGRFRWTRPCSIRLTLLGGVAGMLSGLLGVGGGFVIVPALQRSTNASMHTIVATSLAVISLVSCSGVLSVAYTGQLDWSIAIPFAAGSLAAMLGGRRLAHKANPTVLHGGFAVAAAAAAISLVVKAFS